MRMPSRTPCAEGDGWRLCRACLAWGHSGSRAAPAGPEELCVLQGRRECRGGLGLVALGKVAGKQDASGGTPGHGGWSRGTGLRGDPCSGVTGRHALSLLLALEHPGCHGLLTSAGTLPAAPTPGWNNQKCLQRQTTPG